MKLAFWISVGVIAYTFFIYPLVLLVLAGLNQFRSDLRFALGRGERRNFRSPELPYVSLVIAAHNEGAVIAEKMQNCAALQYPADRLEILVACDGCSDDTVHQARIAGLPNARIFDYRERSGKPALLNRVVPEATGDILIFSDANTMYTPQSVASMVKRFVNPNVGAVCGELKLQSHDGKPKAEGAYWRYECFLKILESRLNMLVGANGAIFAIRRGLYRPLPPRTINDDFLIAMRIRETGMRVVYDPEACAFEETAPMRQEFRRRVRIGSGDARALRQTWQMLIPSAGLIALSYWSHKIFRWLVPFALVSCFITATALAREPFYLGCALLGLVLAGAAAVGYELEGRRRPIRLLHLPSHFLVMNLALMVGFLKDLLGERSGVWAPTQRLPRPVAVTAESTEEESEKVTAVG